jgi:hypothetical protein
MVASKAGLRMASAARGGTVRALLPAERTLPPASAVAAVPPAMPEGEIAVGKNIFLSPLSSLGLTIPRKYEALTRDFNDLLTALNSSRARSQQGALSVASIKMSLDNLRVLVSLYAPRLEFAYTARNRSEVGATDFVPELRVRLRDPPPEEGHARCFRACLLRATSEHYAAFLERRPDVPPFFRDIPALLARASAGLPAAWHGDFRVEDVPDVPPAALPERPSLLRFTLEARPASASEPARSVTIPVGSDAVDVGHANQYGDPLDSAGDRRGASSPAGPITAEMEAKIRQGFSGAVASLPSRLLASVVSRIEETERAQRDAKEEGTGVDKLLVKSLDKAAMAVHRTLETTKTKVVPLQAVLKSLTMNQSSSRGLDEAKALSTTINIHTHTHIL